MRHHSVQTEEPETASLQTGNYTMLSAGLTLRRHGSFTSRADREGWLPGTQESEGGTSEGAEGSDENRSKGWWTLGLSVQFLSFLLSAR